VVRPHALLSRDEKGLVAVVTRLVDAMDERRRYAVLPGCIDAMT
jgi:hypothetical protein